MLEFNCRFGDPETQALLPRLRSDLLELLWRAALVARSCRRAVWSEGPAVGVVMASRGYPASSSRGDVISGLDEAGSVPGVEVLHPGTATSHGKRGDRRRAGADGDGSGRRRSLRRDDWLTRGWRGSASPGPSIAPISRCVQRNGNATVRGRPVRRPARRRRRPGRLGRTARARKEPAWETKEIAARPWSGC